MDYSDVQVSYPRGYKNRQTWVDNYQQVQKQVYKMEHPYQTRERHDYAHESCHDYEFYDHGTMVTEGSSGQEVGGHLYRKWKGLEVRA